MDATDTAAPETRYCGRSQALLYNTIRPHASLGFKPPAPEVFVPAFAAWAGCATPSGSAGHAGETANLKLTFHLDHSAGADQSNRNTNRSIFLGLKSIMLAIQGANGAIPVLSSPFGENE
jgi:hypothetical protein